MYAWNVDPEQKHYKMLSEISHEYHVLNNTEQTNP